MALCVARGGQSPDLKPSHANHFLMTQGTEEQGNRGEKVLELMPCCSQPTLGPRRWVIHRSQGFHTRQKAPLPRASHLHSSCFGGHGWISEG